MKLSELKAALVEVTQYLDDDTDPEITFDGHGLDMELVTITADGSMEMTIERGHLGAFPKWEADLTFTFVEK